MSYFSQSPLSGTIFQVVQDWAFPWRSCSHGGRNCCSDSSASADTPPECAVTLVILLLFAVYVWWTLSLMTRSQWEMAKTRVILLSMMRRGDCCKTVRQFRGRNSSAGCGGNVSAPGGCRRTGRDDWVHVWPDGSGAWRLSTCLPGLSTAPHRA